MTRLWRTATAISAALLVGFLITAAVSDSPVQAYLTLLTGALPDIRWSEVEGWQIRRLVRFGMVIEDAITLTFLGLAIAIPFSARQFSLGADGQMFLAALAAATVSLFVGGSAWVVLPVAFVAAVLTGFTWGLVAGILKERFAANEIVTTLMLNIIAVQLYRWAISGPLRDPQAGFIATPMLPDAALLPLLMPRTNVTVMLLLVPLIVLAAWLLLQRTTLGYEIRVVGQAPSFARQMGMPAKRAVVLSMALGGAFAAFAGIHISNGLLKRLPVDLTPGLGFEGLVVALLARNDPKAVPLAALLYALLRTGAQAMERTTDVPREAVLVIQAFIILFVVSERLFPTERPAWLRMPWRRTQEKAL
jgi:general nucleoside transport system permease protein